jgi:hypothetical protein
MLKELRLFLKNNNEGNLHYQIDNNKTYLYTVVINCGMGIEKKDHSSEWNAQIYP